MYERRLLDILNTKHLHHLLNAKSPNLTCWDYINAGIRGFWQPMDIEIKFQRNQRHFITCSKHVYDLAWQSFEGWKFSEEI